MTYRVVIYLQPWEIDDFQRQTYTLIQSSYDIKDIKDINEEKVIIDVTLNLHMVDWKKSKLPKQYFIDKFLYLETILSNHFQVEFDTDEKINGSLDKRRSIQNKKQDCIIWLDSDIHFSSTVLPTMIAAASVIKDECYILSNQTIKLWDKSWDLLTADRYINESYDFKVSFNVFELDKAIYRKTQNMKVSPYIKFGGGWMTLLSNKVLEQIPLIDELGSYGPDDSYIMYCGMFTKQLRQYIMNDIVVGEENDNLKINKDYIRPLLSLKTASNRDRITDEYLADLVEIYIKNYIKIQNEHTEIKSSNIRITE